MAGSNSQPDKLNRYIDLDRYPVHEPDSRAAREVIAKGHEMMSRDTLCLFEGFLREEAVTRLREEITALEPACHQVDYPCTLYGWMNNAGFDQDHPRSRLLRRHCGVITTDQLDAAGPCFELYRFDALTEFVRRLLGFETLYRSECPTLAIQVNVMRADECFDWHFDTNDGVVSFTIQNADNGGGFEYVPLIRDEDAENYAAVSAILDGVDRPRQPVMQPGCFSLFLGRRSMHRVAPVGATGISRQSLLLSYDRSPGHVFPLKTRQRLSSGSREPYRGAMTPA
jgi:hypothetical protein